MAVVARYFTQNDMTAFGVNWVKFTEARPVLYIYIVFDNNVFCGDEVRYICDS